MYKSRTKQNWYRFDAAAPRVRRPKSRRLAVETLEGRMLLSGNQLDDAIWNLDTIQSADYAVIDQDTSPPVSTPISRSTTDALINAGALVNTGSLGSLGTISNSTPSNLNPGVSSDLNHAEYVSPSLSDGNTPLFAADSLILSSRRTDSIDNGSQFYVFSNASADRLIMAPIGSPVVPTWDLGYSGRGVIVGVVDSGFQIARPISLDSFKFTSFFDDLSGTLPIAGVHVAGLLDARLDLTNWISYTFDNSGLDADYDLASTDSGNGSTNTEGGAIPIEAIVSTVENGSGLAAPAERQYLAAKAAAAESSAERALASSDISGELARAVAFEVIDGEAAPVVYASDGDSRGPAVKGLYAASTADTSRRPTFVLASAQTTAAAADHAAARGNVGAKFVDAVYRPAKLHSGPRPVHLAGYIRSANDGPNGLRWAGGSGAVYDIEALPADAARGEVFSRWGRIAENDDRDAAADGKDSWLKATPLLMVLALERFVASKARRNEDAARSLKQTRPQRLPAR